MKNESNLDNFVEAAKAAIAAGKPMTVEIGRPENPADKPKTPAQQRAVHSWFDKIAAQLNEKGIDRTVVIEALAKRGLDLLWTGPAFKENVYKPVFQAVTTKQSTEDANTTDHDLCYHGIVKWLAMEFEITAPPFPSHNNVPMEVYANGR